MLHDLQGLTNYNNEYKLRIGSLEKLLHEQELDQNEQKLISLNNFNNLKKELEQSQLDNNRLNAKIETLLS